MKSIKYIVQICGQKFTKQELAEHNKEMARFGKFDIDQYEKDVFNLQK